VLSCCVIVENVLARHALEVLLEVDRDVEPRAARGAAAALLLVDVGREHALPAQLGPGSLRAVGVDDPDRRRALGIEALVLEDRPS
jgi:hypothetical protein